MTVCNMQESRTEIISDLSKAVEIIILKPIWDLQHQEIRDFLRLKLILVGIVSLLSLYSFRQFWESLVLMIGLSLTSR